MIGPPQVDFLAAVRAASEMLAGQFVDDGKDVVVVNPLLFRLLGRFLIRPGASGPWKGQRDGVGGGSSTEDSTSTNASHASHFSKVWPFPMV
jgi:hypothetical protein